MSFLVVMGLGACAAEQEAPSNLVGDRADEGSFDVVEIELGESLSGLSVEPLRVGIDEASKAEIDRSVAVLRLTLPEGQSASIAMRAESPGLDAYLIVKDAATGETVAITDDQEFMASASPTDAVVSLRGGGAGDYLIVATGGSDMQSGGQFSVDAIAHDDPLVDLMATGPAQRAVLAELRALESSVADWAALGMLAEGESGLLEQVPEALDGVPLQERAELIRTMRAVNNDRSVLFDQFIEHAGVEGASRESVGRAVAPIYARSRQ